MQVAIPAAGRGTRIRQLSDPLSKPTLTVADRPPVAPQLDGEFAVRDGDTLRDPAGVRDPFDAGPRVAAGHRSSVDGSAVGLAAWPAGETGPARRVPPSTDTTTLCAMREP